jgi:polyisoprenoid-binding protein YceI
MSAAMLPRVAGAFLLAIGMRAADVSAQSRAIDVEQSSFKVRVFKTGFFSAFAHDHEIDAPIAAGTVDTSTSSRVTLRVDIRAMRVLDPEASPSTRGEIQKTMEGPTVLDSERFPRATFESTGVEQKGNDRWTVHGELTLHGQTKPVAVDVALKDGHYRGSTTIKQRAFGMIPVSVAGGTVKVKDEVRIEFDIVLAQ